MKLGGDGPVVLVDDDEIDIEILSRSFSRSMLSDSVELVTFADGMSFLAHMDEVLDGKAELPSIVLLDINMPRMNGFEVLERLRSCERFADVPAVMFVSNSDNPHDIERCRTLGAGFQEKFERMQDCIEFFNSLHDS